MATAYHEPAAELSPETRDLHRALASLIEELEAIDWYQQRVDRTPDGELKTILAHNRDEEIEHAAMTLEWLRRRVPEFDAQLRKYLFTSASITAAEIGAAAAPAGSGEPPAAGRGLGIGRFTKEG